jgi:hypothetical protein
MARVKTVFPMGLFSIKERIPNLLFLILGLSAALILTTAVTACGSEQPQATTTIATVANPTVAASPSPLSLSLGQSLNSSTSTNTSTDARGSGISLQDVLANGSSDSDVVSTSTSLGISPVSVEDSTLTQTEIENTAAAVAVTTPTISTTPSGVGADTSNLPPTSPTAVPISGAGAGAGGVPLSLFSSGGGTGTGTGTNAPGSTNTLDNPPVKLEVGKLGINATILVMGTERVYSKQAGKVIETWQAPAADKGGWHRGSGNACAGENSNPVLNGHNFWQGRPAIFTNLYRLQVGDTLRVSGKNGMVCEYTVVSNKRYDSGLDRSWLSGADKLPKVEALPEETRNQGRWAATFSAQDYYRRYYADTAGAGTDNQLPDDYEPGFGFLTIYTCDEEFVGRVVIKALLTSTTTTTSSASASAN